MIYIISILCIIIIGCLYLLNGQKERLESLERRIDTQNNDLAQMQISIRRMMARA